MKHIQLVLTEKCNLFCEYCYMNKRNSTMTRETFDAFFGSLLPSSYAFDFFGGEPLINWELIPYIVDKVLSTDGFEGSTFAIYTNGTLLDEEKVQFILDNKIHVYWSCDGVMTNETRPTANGSTLEIFEEKWGLFAKVVASVGAMVTPKNLNFIENHKFVMGNYGLMPNFRIIREDIWSPESVAEFEENFDAYIRFIAEEFLAENISDIPPFLRTMLRDLIRSQRLDAKPHGCCVDGCTVGVMPDGTTGLCAMYMTDGKTPVYHKEFFDKCESCDLKMVCERGCYYSVEKNGGLIDEICQLYNIMYKFVIYLNHKLMYNKRWKYIIGEIVDGTN